MLMPRAARGHGSQALPWKAEARPVPQGENRNAWKSSDGRNEPRNMWGLEVA